MRLLAGGRINAGGGGLQRIFSAFSKEFFDFRKFFENIR
jgi:hypothetical protein